MKLFLSKRERQEKKYWQKQKINIPRFLCDENYLILNPNHIKTTEIFIQYHLSEEEFTFYKSILRVDSNVAEILVYLYRYVNENNLNIKIFSQEFTKHYNFNFLEKFCLKSSWGNTDDYDFSIIKEFFKTDATTLIPFFLEIDYNQAICLMNELNLEKIKEFVNSGFSLSFIANNIQELSAIKNVPQMAQFMLANEQYFSNEQAYATFCNILQKNISNQSLINDFKGNLEKLNQESITQYLQNIIFISKKARLGAGSDIMNENEFLSMFIKNSEIVIPESFINYVNENQHSINHPNTFIFMFFRDDIPESFKREILKHAITLKATQEPKQIDMDKIKNLLRDYVLGIRIFNSQDYINRDFVNTLTEMMNLNPDVSPETKHYYEILQKINNSNNPEELLSFLNMNLQEAYHHVFEEIVLFKNKEMNDSLLKVNELKESDKVTIEEKEGLKYITLHALPFRSLIHNITDWSNHPHKAERIKQILNNPEAWLKERHGTNYLSMSYNSDTAFYCFGMGLLTLGYSYLSDKQIKLTVTGDNSTNSMLGTTISETATFSPLSNLLTQSSYNEVISQRDGVLPNYLLIADKTTENGLSMLNEATKKWAKYFNIPIVVIDTQSYIEMYRKIYNDYLQELKQHGQNPHLEEIQKLEFLRNATNMFAHREVISRYTMLFEDINLDLDNIDINVCKFLKSYINSDKVKTYDKMFEFKNQILPLLKAKINEFNKSNQSEELYPEDAPTVKM